MTKKIISHTLLLCAVATVLLTSGCGKHETTGGTVGAATGAAIGAAVSGRHSKGEGAIIGGLIGNIVGRSAGQAEDRKETREEHEKEVQSLQRQNHNLRRQLTKWCDVCGKQVRITGAQSCPDCGGPLIQEKFCERCRQAFSPDTGYKYCPYCSVKARLQSR